jgi:otoferlin
MDATMIDKRLSDKSIQFEISMGNAGNSLDGQIHSVKAVEGTDPEKGSQDLGERERDSIDCRWRRIKEKSLGEN